MRIVLLILILLLHNFDSVLTAQTVKPFLIEIEKYIQLNIDSATLLLNKIPKSEVSAKPDDLIHYYRLLASVQRQKANYDSAVKVYFLAIEVCKKNKRTDSQARIYDDIAYAYQRLRETDQLKLYAEKSLEFKLNQGLDSLLGSSYYMLGNFFWYTSQFIEAKLNYLNSLKYNSKYNPNSLGKNYSVLANVYTSLNQVDSANYYYNMSLEFYANYPNQKELLYVLIGYSRFLIKDKKLKKAEALLDSTSNLLERTKDSELKRTYYSAIASLHSYLGYYEKAYEAKKKQLEMVAENFQKERAAAVKEVEERYKRDKKVLASQNQRNISIATGVFLFTILIVVYFLFTQKIKAKKLEVIGLEKDKKLLGVTAVIEGQESERKRIAQDLHDGLGVLLTSTKFQLSKFEIIAAKTGSDLNFQDLTKQIDTACSEVRKIAHNMMPGVLIKLGLKEALEELMDQAEHRFDLEVVRNFGDGNFDITENAEIMIYRIFQELLNNTIKHSGANSAFFALKKDKSNSGLLILRYRDDGTGFNPQNDFQGMGIKSIHSRVAYLNANITLVTEIDKGVDYVIQIPLERKFVVN